MMRPEKSLSVAQLSKTLESLQEEINEEKGINSSIKQRMKNNIIDNTYGYQSESSRNMHFSTTIPLNILNKIRNQTGMVEQRDTDKMVESQTESVFEAFHNFGKKIARLREVL